jgi:TusA-related sulfurtransferase
VKNKIKSNLILNTLGEYCPIPIIKTQEYINKIKMGEVLEILSDDKGIIKDMIDWCKGSGNEFIGFDKDNDKYRLYIKRLV